MFLHQLGDPVREVEERAEEDQADTEQPAGDHVRQLLERVRRVRRAVPAQDHDDDPERSQDPAEHHQDALVELEGAAADAQPADALGEPLVTGLL